MKYVKTAAFLLVLLLLQTTFFKIMFGTMAPNLLLAAAICFAIRENDYIHSAVFGLCCGVLLDYTSGALFGVATLLCTICCALITMLGPHMFKAKFAANLLLLFVTAMIYEFFYYVFCYGLWEQSNYWQVLFTSVLPSAVFGTAAGLLMMPVMRHIAASFAGPN